MKTLFFLLLANLSILALGQEYFQTTTNSAYLNKVIRNNGRIILGSDIENTTKFQIYQNDNNIVGSLLGNNSGRLRFNIVSANGQVSPWTKVGDAIIINYNGSKNLHFHMPNNNSVDPNSDTSTPNSPGITRIRFSDVANKNILLLFNTGKVTMGTDLYDDSDYRLFVKDGIKTEKVKVELASENGWADYVFENNYNLLSIKELESFITENKHLPNIPSAKQVIDEGGFELKEMNIKLLEKVEEQSLYIIQLHNDLEELKSEIKELRDEINGNK
ncbi:MAG: hypothetical protein WBF83_08420 [Moheibacter sp.]